MNQVGVGSIDKVVWISRFHQLAGWRARLLVPVLTGITEFGKHDSRVTWDLSTKLITHPVLCPSCEDQMAQDSSRLVWVKCSANSSCLLPFQIILKMITALITHCFVFEGHSVAGMGQDPQLKLSCVCITVVVSRTSIKIGSDGMTGLLNSFSDLPELPLGDDDGPLFQTTQVLNAWWTFALWRNKLSKCQADPHSTTSWSSAWVSLVGMSMEKALPASHDPWLVPSSLWCSPWRRPRNSISQVSSPNQMSLVGWPKTIDCWYLVFLMEDTSHCTQSLFVPDLMVALASFHAADVNPAKTAEGSYTVSFCPERHGGRRSR